MESYKATYILNFLPLDFTPYKQTVYWTRPENGEFHTYVKGTWNLAVGKFFVRVEEDAKTCQYSAYDMSQTSGYTY
jgi:hypothetical protein